MQSSLVMTTSARIHLVHGVQQHGGHLLVDGRIVIQDNDLFRHQGFFNTLATFHATARRAGT